MLCICSYTTMGGSISTGRNNDELVDNLIEADYLKTPALQQVFRAVDRGDYYSKGDRSSAYRDSAYRNGNLHLSAPCVYSEVMEALKLRNGLSFLNLGSGSGYLSTIAGLILGPYGVNHGIELFQDVVDFAYSRLEEFLKHSEAVDAYEFCEPKFVVGNCLKIDNCNSPLYDRVYCGAACPEEHEMYMRSLIKIGGILVMPLNNKLLQITRTGECSWSSSKVLSVSFAPLHSRGEKDTSSFLTLPDITPPRLQELCRAKVRSVLRQCIDVEHPDLQKRKTVPRAKSKCHVRRIVIPIVDASESESSNSQSNSDDDNDDNNESDKTPKVAVGSFVPSRTTAFIESFMRYKASIEEVVAGPSNWQGTVSSTAAASATAADATDATPNTTTTPASGTPAKLATPQTTKEETPGKAEDSGISDSDINTDDGRSHTSDSEAMKPQYPKLWDSSSPKERSSGSPQKKQMRKRQHSGSEQRSVKNRKRVVSNPRLKLRRTATVIWKKIASGDPNSDSEMEEKQEKSEKPPAETQPNYTSYMVEKIKALPLPVPLQSYLNYRRDNM